MNVIDQRTEVGRILHDERRTSHPDWSVALHEERQDADHAAQLLDTERYEVQMLGSLEHSKPAGTMKERGSGVDGDEVFPNGFPLRTEIAKFKHLLAYVGRSGGDRP